ncbi:VanZ family protein [Sporosarcina luteola]|uniref:VanZ family protein n=1 Tax=Sporosarcina luteola TaxID=582850 RepID=UPI0020403DD9|nr:VanZ family protein [Sporosarcina luteola]MCM3743962.1 VanZ family protein [Sporosarcina luteola]
MKKLIVFLLIVGVLFISSSQTYEEQSLISTLEKWLPNQPMYFLLEKIEVPYWGRTISIEERGYYYFVEFLLRKSAHFLIFGCLAVVIYFLFSNKIRSIYRFSFSLLLTGVVAALDEYHQSLTGGRTSTIYDIALDISGAFIFLLLVQVTLLVKTKFSRSKPHRI